MASDDDFHDLLTTFPEALLALLPVSPRGPYRGEAVEVKRTSGRFDGVLRPTVAGDPRIYLEWQDRRDPQVERRFAIKLAVHCEQEGSYGGVVAAIVYTNRRSAQAARSADVTGPAGSVSTFRPLRIVLSQDVDAARLVARGGPALVLLPLVAPAEQVEVAWRRWARDVRSRAAPDERGRRRALEVFARFLVWRLGRLKAKPEEIREVAMGLEEHVIGKILMAKGRAEGRAEGRAVTERRVLTRLLTSKFGRVPPARAKQVKAASPREVARWTLRVLTASTLDEVFAEPARRSRATRRARGRSR